MISYTLILRSWFCIACVVSVPHEVERAKSSHAKIGARARIKKIIIHGIKFFCSRPNFRATNRRETLYLYETLATWVKFCDNEYEATNLGTKTVGEVSISFIFF